MHLTLRIGAQTAPEVCRGAVSNHDLRYNGFTLSDLDASGDSASNRPVNLAQISPKPLQRVPIGLLPGGQVRNRVTVGEQLERSSLD